MPQAEIKVEYTGENALIIPFSVQREQASGLLRRQFSKSFFTPVEFTHAAQTGNLEAAYFPVYLFSGQMQSAIKADCTKRDGEAVIHRRAQRVVDSDFSKLIYSSCEEVDDQLLRLLEPYELKQAIAYDRLEEYRAEFFSASLKPEDFTAELKKRFEDAAIQAAKDNLKDYTSSEIVAAGHKLTSMSTRQLFLPMWILNCRYKGRDYRIFVNGQTGKIAGVPPNSTTKPAAIIAAAAAVGAILGQLIWTVVSSLT